MEINLQTVREVIRSSFGRESFVASFITKVEADEGCPTAGIDGNGVMRYNPRFVERYVVSPADLFCLIAHEMMHPLFGHFVYEGGKLENIGADMVINSTLSLLYAKNSDNGSLFRRFYQPISLEGLLRPGSDMLQSAYNQLYGAFYKNQTASHPLSTGEVIQTLKVLTPMQNADSVTLLGNHEGGSASGNGIPGKFTAETLSRIADDLRRTAQIPTGTMGGYAEELYRFFLDILKTHRSLKRNLLDRYTTRRKIDRFRQSIQQPRIGVSPIPIRPSKRDFVLLAAGMQPWHYHNQTQRIAHQQRGLAIYLDVSGSVNQHLPEIVGLLRSLSNDLKTIYLFSNTVVEVPFKTLLAGHIQTTYGTDFDCIAEHLLDSRIDKAVIITDGYASMTEENQEQLRQRGLRALTVLFGGRTDSPEFEKLGDVVQLEDICA